MVEKIKLFKNVRNLFESMGIYPSPRSAINSKSAFYFLSQAIYSVTSVAYFAYRAKSVREYGDSFYIAVTEATTAIYAVIYVWKQPNISKIIKKFEIIIQSSKICEIFSILKLSRKIKVKFLYRIGKRYLKNDVSRIE